MDILVEYLLFVGSGLYLLSFGIFLFLFLRTLKTKDGVGLVFLKFLTFSLSIGSLVIFTIRVLSEYGDLGMNEARAIAVVNPILLVVVALYLNYLFHNPKPKIGLTKTDSENITSIDKNTKETNKNVKLIKDEVVK